MNANRVITVNHNARGLSGIKCDILLFQKRIILLTQHNAPIYVP